MRNRLLLVAILVAVSTVCAAQQPLNNAAVLKMHAAGLGDDLLTQTINSNPGTYATGVDDLIALKTAGISDKVIGAMIAKNSGATTAAAAATSSETTAASHLPKVFVFSFIVAFNGTDSDKAVDLRKNLDNNCPALRTTIVQDQADYTLLMKNAGFAGISTEIDDKSGNLLVHTKTAHSFGGAGKDICAAITADWQSKAAK
jgi:hypothetical protein